MPPRPALRGPVEGHVEGARLPARRGRRVHLPPLANPSTRVELPSAGPPSTDACQPRFWVSPSTSQNGLDAPETCSPGRGREERTFTCGVPPSTWGATTGLPATSGSGASAGSRVEHQLVEVPAGRVRAVRVPVGGDQRVGAWTEREPPARPARRARGAARRRRGPSELDPLIAIQTGFESTVSSLSVHTAGMSAGGSRLVHSGDAELGDAERHGERDLRVVVDARLGPHAREGESEETSGERPEIERHGHGVALAPAVCDGGSFDLDGVGCGRSRSASDTAACRTPSRGRWSARSDGRLRPPGGRGGRPSPGSAGSPRSRVAERPAPNPGDHMVAGLPSSAASAPSRRSPGSRPEEYATIPVPSAPGLSDEAVDRVVGDERVDRGLSLSA